MMAKRFLAVAAAFLLPCAAVFAQKMSVYTQTILERGERPSLLQAAPERVSAFVYIAPEADVSALSARYALDVRSLSDSLLTVRVAVGNVAALAADSLVSYVEVGQPVALQMSAAKPLGNVPAVASGASLPQPYGGAGVVVGIVDLGFQYNHINFYDAADGYRTLRVKEVYDCISDISYSTQAEIEKKKFDLAAGNEGHGTHVAGIAAGAFANSSRDFSGVAPEADLVLVSLGDGAVSMTDIYNGVRHVIDYAKRVGKPAVVNLSLGTTLGPHDGQSVFDVNCDNLLAQSGAGFLLVGAAGNNGGDYLYTENKLPAGASAVNFVEPTDAAFSSQIDIWGDASQKFKVSLVFADLRGRILLEQPISRPSGSFAAANTFSRYASGKIKYATATGRYNRKNECLLTLENFKANAGYKFGVKISATDAGMVRLWGEDGNIRWADATSSAFTVGEVGGTGNSVISVGSFNSTVSAVGELSYFSAKGPTADLRLKPDVVAPGYSVLSSVPENVTGMPQKMSVSGNGKNYYFGQMAGTSMSTPFVTGVLALWLQAEPTLTVGRVRDVLAATCKTDSYTGAVPNYAWGFGKIDAYEGIKYILQTTGAETLRAQPDVVFGVEGDAARILFPHDAQRAEISLHDARGRLLWHAADNFSGEVCVPLVNLSGGVYIFNIKTEKSNYIHKIIK